MGFLIKSNVSITHLEFFLLQRYVRAVLTGDPENGLTIHEFTSFSGGQGNGERAVRWLKNKCGSLLISDPGTKHDSPNALAFWTNLCSKGLIDEMIDREGSVIYTDGRWLYPDGLAD